MRVRRILVVAGALILGTAAVLGGALYTMKLHFNAEAPEPGYPKPANALAAQRQDLDYFRRLIALDRSYSDTARADANARLDRLAQDSHVLGWGQLRTRLMQIAALADNGHTGVNSGNNRKPNAAPLRVTGFSDGVYVMRAKPPFADLIGARVEKVDGVPTEQVLAKLDTLRGALPAWRRLYSQIWIQSPEMLNGVGIAAKPDATTWTLRRADGSGVERTLPGVPLGKDEAFEDPSRWLSTDPTDKQTRDWRTAAVPMPLTLRDFNKTFRREWIGGSCTMFLQMKAIDDGPGQKIGDWLRETEDAMAARKPCAVILDLRYNTGGDYTNTWTFTHKLPQLMAPGARVFVLTGPQTFSATITTTAFIKETLGDRAVILGEPVGDRLRFLAEGGSGCLPNSGICFHYSTGMHDYSAPCTDWNVCFWLNWFYPVRVKTLAPDETVHLSHADYLSGRDPAFERALTLARAAR